MADCSHCNDEGWVCENHPDVPWEGGSATCCAKEGKPWNCGAGTPCRACNPSDEFNPPREPYGFTPIFDGTGDKRH